MGAGAGGQRLEPAAVAAEILRENELNPTAPFVVGFDWILPSLRCVGVADVAVTVSDTMSSFC